MRGKSIDAIIGEGGQPKMGPYGRSASPREPKRLQPVVPIRSAAVGTGGEDGQAKMSGRRGKLAKVRERERTRLMGIMGRLRKACHGQLLGSSVSRMLYLGRVVV